MGGCCIGATGHRSLLQNLALVGVTEGTQISFNDQTQRRSAPKAQPAAATDGDAGGDSDGEWEGDNAEMEVAEELEDILDVLLLRLRDKVRGKGAA